MRRFIFLSFFVVQNVFAFNLNTSTESKWEKDVVSVDYNNTSCGDDIKLPEDLETAIDLSWNSISSSNLRLEIGNATTDTAATSGRILVQCSSLGTSTAGVTSISFTSEEIITGEIDITTDINWSVQDETALPFTIAHELGHAIGFSHSEDEEAMMFFSGFRQKIAQDDVDAATYLYPRNDLSDGPLGCGSIDIDTIGPGNSSAIVNWLIAWIMILVASTLIEKINRGREA